MSAIRTPSVAIPKRARTRLCHTCGRRRNRREKNWAGAVVDEATRTPTKVVTALCTGREDAVDQARRSEPLCKDRDVQRCSCTGVVAVAIGRSIRHLCTVQCTQAETAEPSLAERRAASRFGIAIAAMMPMITTTIKSSISEKPF